MSSSTVSSVLLFALSCTSAFAQITQVQFNQVLNVNGDMIQNSFQFPDGSRIETYSQSQQQLIVNQQNPSIPANQVTGSTGGPFVQISPSSMTISTNGATNLVGGQVEMAINKQNLQTQRVAQDNTYVAMLSPDRQSWQIQESLRSINGTDTTVRMVKRNQLDGEYMIVGRVSNTTDTLVVPFGSTPQTAVNIIGSGLQENEFNDGFRTSVRATQPMTMNVNVKKGVDQGMLAALQGQQTSINDYRYSVNTNLGAVLPSLNNQVTVIQMPVNAVRIQKMMQAANVAPTGMVAISVAQRTVLQNPGGATAPLNAPGAITPQRRAEFREALMARQKGQTGQNGNGQNGNGQTGNGQTGTQTNGNQNGTPTLGQAVAQTLLLSPTFTPIQAAAVLDQTNMRIAIPVRQVDGEFILTMQVMSGGAVGPAQGVTGGQGTQPTTGQQPTGQRPGATTGTQPTGQQIPTAGQQPTTGTQPTGQRPSGEPTTGTQPTGQRPTEPTTGGNGTASAITPRQAAAAPQLDQYGWPIAPLGSVMVSMKQIDEMAAMVINNGQVPITSIMNDFVTAQTGSNSTASAASGPFAGLNIST